MSHACSCILSTMPGLVISSNASKKGNGGSVEQVSRHYKHFREDNHEERSLCHKLKIQCNKSCTETKANLYHTSVQVWHNKVFSRFYC